jgi:hypothetical protein
LGSGVRRQRLRSRRRPSRRGRSCSTRRSVRTEKTGPQSTTCSPTRFSSRCRCRAGCAAAGGRRGTSEADQDAAARRRRARHTVYARCRYATAGRKLRFREGTASAGHMLSAKNACCLRRRNARTRGSWGGASGAETRRPAVRVSVTLSCRSLQADAVASVRCLRRCVLAASAWRPSSSAVVSAAAKSSSALSRSPRRPCRSSA